MDRRLAINGFGLLIALILLPLIVVAAAHEFMIGPTVILPLTVINLILFPLVIAKGYSSTKKHIKKNYYTGEGNPTPNEMAKIIAKEVDKHPWVQKYESWRKKYGDLVESIGDLIKMTFLLTVLLIAQVVLMNRLYIFVITGEGDTQLNLSIFVVTIFLVLFDVAAAKTLKETLDEIFDFLDGDTDD